MPTIEELKRKWVWITLAITLLIAVIIGPEDDPVVNNRPNKHVPITSASDKNPKLSSPAYAILPIDWPVREIEISQIKDVFQAGTISTVTKKSVQNALTPQAPPLSQDQFDHEIFGAVSDGPIQTAFLLTPDKRVITVEVGNNINQVWKLVALDTNQATLMHLPSGKTFQLQLRSTS